MVGKSDLKSCDVGAISVNSAVVIVVVIVDSVASQDWVDAIVIASSSNPADLNAQSIRTPFKLLMLLIAATSRSLGYPSATRMQRLSTNQWRCERIATNQVLQLVSIHRPFPGSFFPACIRTLACVI